ncbi:MAG: sugar phosphate isomerase/epimerase [Albidovulum sp.]|nr:sugar phosphate isomerase/epimerase [Albidovulum sp.]
MSAWKLGYQANCWGPLGGNAVGVTSITELTYRTFGGMDCAMADIAAAGYEGIELFDGNLLDYSAAEFQKLLDKNGLILVAAYSGANFIFTELLDEELAKIRCVADRVAELGAPHLVVGGGAKRREGTRDGDYSRLADALEQVVRIAADRGLSAHYHPHLTTIVEGPEEVRRIFSETSIKFCPDTAHLAAAGGDPAAMIREHANRITYIHLKGWRRDPFAFTPLDRGDLDSKPILKAIRDIEFDGWITVELDAWDDPRKGAELSKSYLDQA